VLPPALWSGRTVESTFGADVEEEHRLFVHETVVFFLEGEERSERNGHVCGVNESEPISAGVTYLSERWDQTQHEQSSLFKNFNFSFAHFRDNKICKTL
jgi:hypothetical protein